MNKKILVIDDETDFHEIVKELLSEITNNIIFASDGKQGLDLIHKENPDLIITDYNMPKMTGLELLQKLDTEGCRTPIIWITGRGTPEIYNEAWTFGVFEFFEKPVDFDKFKLCIKAALTKVESKTENVQMNIPEKIFNKLKIKCESSKISITSYINKLIENDLK